MTMMLMLLVTDAFAAGGAGDPPDYNAIAFHLINFVLFVSLLTFLLRGKLKDALANRAVRVKGDIDESNRLRKEAQQRFEELEARLDGFESELATMKTDAVTNAEAEHKNILERAEDDAARIAESAQRSIRDETDRARQALRREVAELSVDLARDKLSKNVTADDQSRFAGDFIDTVQGKSGGSNG
jgi:F-type H+-transporting ATPase subunit b